MKHLKLEESNDEESTRRVVRVSQLLLNSVLVSTFMPNFDPGNKPPVPSCPLARMISLAAENPGHKKPRKKRSPSWARLAEKQMEKISNTLAHEIYSMIAALKECPSKSPMFGATKEDCVKVANVIEDRIAELGKIKVYRKGTYVTEGWKFLSSLYKRTFGSISRYIQCHNDRMINNSPETLIEEAKSSAIAILNDMFKVFKQRSKNSKTIRREIIKKIDRGRNDLPLGIAIGKATLLALNDFISNVDNRDNGGVLGHIASTCLESVRIAFNRNKYLAEIYGNILNEIKFNELPMRHGFLMRMCRAKADSARGIDLTRNVVDSRRTADGTPVYVVAELVLAFQSKYREIVLAASKAGKTVRICTLQTNEAGDPTGVVHVAQNDDLVVYARGVMNDWIAEFRRQRERELTDVEDTCTLFPENSFVV